MSTLPEGPGPAPAVRPVRYILTIDLPPDVPGQPIERKLARLLKHLKRAWGARLVEVREAQHDPASPRAG